MSRSSQGDPAVGEGLGDRTGMDEAVVVECDQAAEPVGAWPGADEHEHRPSWQSPPLAAAVVLDDYRFDPAGADDLPDLVVQVNRYVLVPLHLVDQVPGHVG
nr:hypothetical protein [Micromonospora sp. DSM 115978]